MLGESSRATSCAAVLNEGLPASVGAEGTRAPCISVQARLHFVGADLEGEIDDVLRACSSSLARSGFNPQRQDYTLTIEGDLETVSTALKRCSHYMQRTRVCHGQQPDIEIAAVAEGVSTIDLICAVP
jgi:uncharacterized protein YqgV (UPF0045/DUF77 family)